TMTKRSKLAGLLVAVIAVASTAGCGDDAKNDVTAGDAAVAGDAGEPGSGGTCPPEGERSYPLLDAPHVTDIASIHYNSSPPSSGPAGPQWLRPGVYPQPQPRCNWIHNLEHGYVVLLYNCPTGCPDIVDKLTAVIPNVVDPDCSPRRVLLTPDPLLDVKVA